MNPTIKKQLDILKIRLKVNEQDFLDSLGEYIDLYGNLLSKDKDISFLEHSLADYLNKKITKKQLTQKYKNYCDFRDM